MSDHKTIVEWKNFIVLDPYAPAWKAAHLKTTAR